MYNDFDMNKIFKEGDNEYSFDKIDDESIKRVENKLGYKFPKSFIELLKIRNGGEIKDYECWMTGIYGISKEENNSKSLENRYDFWINEWEYPKTAIPFGDTQSAGHDLYCFDYSNLNQNGEPKIVLIDNELDNRVKVIADDFEKFMNMVYNGEELTNDESYNIEPGKTVVVVKDNHPKKNIVIDSSKNDKSSSIGLLIFGIICLIIGILIIASSSYLIDGIFMIIFGVLCILLPITILRKKKR